MKYVFGLDLGTTTIKATMFDETGRPVADDAVERTLLMPQPGYLEQDAEQWFTDSAMVIRNAVQKSGVDPRDIVGLSISSQGITLVPVSEDQKAMANAINWMDNRPVEQLKRLIDAVSVDRIFHTTGKDGHSPAYSITKLMWFKDNMPEIYEKARWFLMPMDFVTMKLTGNVVTDHSMAAGGMCYSLADAAWDDEIIAAAGVKKSLLPEIKWAGESAGHLTAEAAAACGLTTDCIVAVGGQDQKVAAFGAKIAPGVVTFSMGTCGAFEFLLDAPKAHPDRALTLCPHVEPNKWVLEGCINTVGGAIKWCRDNVCPGLSYVDMNVEAEKAAPGSGGAFFYPFLAGRGTPHHESGTPAGGYTGLALHTTRADLIRSVYEGIAYESRLNLEAAEVLVGKIQQINAFSGGSKGAIVCRILAEVTGCTVHSYAYAEMGNLGAARLAAKACGLDWEAFGEPMLADSRDTVPSELQPEYDALFREYCKKL